jgi:hypothetical protein
MKIERIKEFQLIMEGLLDDYSDVVFQEFAKSLKENVSLLVELYRKKLVV